MIDLKHGIFGDKAGAGQSTAKTKTDAKGAEMKGRGQVLSGIRHGAHVSKDESRPAVEFAAKREDITLLKDAVAGFAVAGTAGAAVARTEPEEVLFETPFDYLFLDLTTKEAAHLPADDPAKVVAGLKASAMRWWRTHSHREKTPCSRQVTRRFHRSTPIGASSLTTT